MITRGFFPLVILGGSAAYISQLFSFQRLGFTATALLLIFLFAALGAKTVALLSGPRRAGSDLLLGFLVILSVKALSQALTWGVCDAGNAVCASSFDSMEYLSFAFLAIYAAPWIMGLLAVYAALIELGYYAGPAVFVAAAEPDVVRAAVPGVAARFAYDLAFGVGFGMFIRGERSRREAAVGELERLEREAQTFRLQNVVAEPGAGFEAMSRAGREEAEKRAVQRLRHKEEEIAKFLKRTLRCYSAAIFRIDPSTQQLELRAWATDSRRFRSPVYIRPGEGVIGWIFREKEILQLGEASRPLADLPYYESRDEDVKSFLGAPIMAGDRPLGVVLVDSREVGVFGEEHRNALEVAARMVLEAVQNEELRSRQETEALQLQAMLDLSRRVTADLDVGEICKQVVLSVHRIVPYRIAVVALRDEATGNYRLEYAARGEAGEAVEDSEWLGAELDADEASVVHLAMRQDGPYLIDNYRRRDKSKRPPIYSARLKAPELDTILGVPLLHGEARVGCLVLGAAGADVFEETERKLFGILANLFASSLLNASKHREASARALTDALTKLANRARFKEALAQQAALSKRSKQPVSLLLMDIDYFKKVNDTYGHPGGDAVLVQVADILREASREVDLPCRFGGEEFLVLLPNTTRRDAVRMAERIRKMIERHPFELPDGRTIKVTMSIGCATYPDDTSQEEILADKADQALYGAKAAGRNRVQQYCDLPDGDATTSWLGSLLKKDKPKPAVAKTGGAPEEKDAEKTGGGSKWRFGS